MAETMEQYMSKPRADYGSDIARPKIDDKDHFELKGQFLKELRDNTFSGSDHEYVNEHIEKVLEIVDLFHVPNITQDQEDLKTKFLSKYCPPARTAKKMEEINNFQQEPDETIYQACKRFKELLMKCPQHYLTETQEVILFYNGLEVPNRQILNLKGAIPTKTTADAKPSKHNLIILEEKSRRLMKRFMLLKWDVRQSKRLHYTKDCPLKEEGKTLEEAYYTQFGTPFQQGWQYRAAALGFYQRNNANPSYQERRQSMEESLSKFISESTKRHKENSNLIKEIRASTNAAIRNQGASIKTLEIQIGQMNKFILTNVEADMTPIHCIRSSQYAVLAQQNKRIIWTVMLGRIDDSLPRKEKDPGSFTLPCYINNVCFENALADLGASMPIPDPNSTYTKPPSEIQILEFIKTLGYAKDPKTKTNAISKMVATILHQPWRAILSVLNRCLTGKDSSWDTVRLPILQILWGIVHSADLDFTSLIWDEFEWQTVERSSKPSKMSKLLYTRFTKLIIDYILSHNKSIPRRSDSKLHSSQDD
ncbi:hypothetical protein Tco_0764500 [Tanacetum coccineum]